MKTKPLPIHVLRSGYVVGKKQVRTVRALEAELIRLRTTQAHVQPTKDAPWRKLAAVLRVMQRRGIFIGFVGARAPD